MAKRVAKILMPIFGMETNRGFSLLELLVVVFILALTSSILVPMLLRVSDGAIVSEADKLANTLSELSERSLFLGQLTALQLDETSYRPVYFDVEQERFIAFNQNNLKARTLAADMNVEWLADASSDRNKNVISRGLTQQDQSDDEMEFESSTEQKDDIELPSIYFLPSGDATAGTLVLKTDDQQQTLYLSAFGKVTRLNFDERSDDQALPDLILPDDFSFAQQSGALK